MRNPDQSGAPDGIGSGGIRLDGSQVTAIAAFLRVLNSLENIRSTQSLADRAKLATSSSQARELLQLSLSEIEDAIDVLKCASLHPEARNKLVLAGVQVGIAILTSNKTLRNHVIDGALTQLAAARADMVIE